MLYPSTVLDLPEGARHSPQCYRGTGQDNGDLTDLCCIGMSISLGVSRWDRRQWRMRWGQQWRMRWGTDGGGEEIVKASGRKEGAKES